MCKSAINVLCSASYICVKDFDFFFDHLKLYYIRYKNQNYIYIFLQPYPIQLSLPEVHHNERIFLERSKTCNK